MANASLALFDNVSIKLIDVGDGSLALATKAVTAGTAMAAGDVAASIFGINKPIRLVKLSDGTYALATSTAVVPKPAADLTIPLFGTMYSVRLVALGDGTYALATAAQGGMRTKRQ